MLLLGTLALSLGLTLNLAFHNVSAQGMADPGRGKGQYIATQCININISWRVIIVVLEKKIVLIIHVQIVVINLYYL